MKQRTDFALSNAMHMCICMYTRVHVPCDGTLTLACSILLEIVIRSVGVCIVNDGTCQCMYMYIFGSRSRICVSMLCKYSKVVAVPVKIMLCYLHML